MRTEYIPKTTHQKLGYLVEECGEVQAALGKTLRWGLESFNPELEQENRETNRDWVLREIVDLERAIEFVKAALRSIEKPEAKEPPGELPSDEEVSVQANRWYAGLSYTPTSQAAFRDGQLQMRSLAAPIISGLRGENKELKNTLGQANTANNILDGAVNRLSAENTRLRAALSEAKTANLWVAEHKTEGQRFTRNPRYGEDFRAEGYNLIPCRELKEGGIR